VKNFFVIAAAIISILGMGSPGWGHTVTVINNVGTIDCSIDYPYKVYYMAEVNFYYNAIENVKAQTAYIPSGESYTYDSGKWCPSGVTGYMYVKTVNSSGRTVDPSGTSTGNWKIIILAADNLGRHNAGLNVACQSSVFKINILDTSHVFNCAPWNFRDNFTFTFDRQ
jgi:hypothetical protein